MVRGKVLHRFIWSLREQFHSVCQFQRNIKKDKCLNKQIQSMWNISRSILSVEAKDSVKLISSMAKRGVC